MKRMPLYEEQMSMFTPAAMNNNNSVTGVYTETHDEPSTVGPILPTHSENPNDDESGLICFPDRPRVRDQYEETASTLDELGSLLTERHKESAWHAVQERSTKIFDVEESVELAPDVYSDTVSGTGSHLAMKMAGKDVALRGSAKENLDQVLKGLLSQLSMGNPDQRLVYTKVANLLLGTQKKGMTVLTRREKVTGILSGGYREIPAEEFVRRIFNALEDSFGGVSFESGWATQTFCIATAELPDAAIELQDAEETIVPAVRVFTADNGASAATIQPLLKVGNGRPLPFVGAVKMVHKGQGDWVQELDKVKRGLLAGFKKARSQAEWLIAFDLRNPAEAAIAAGRAVKLPSTVYSSVGDAIRFESETGAEFTAYDVIMRLADSYTAFVEDKAAAHEKSVSQMKRLQMEDSIGKLVFLDWEDLDTASR